MSAAWYDPFNESIRLAKAMETPGLRWYVRLEHARPARLGEPARDGLQWAAFPYVDRNSDGEPVRITASTFFPSRSRALAYAARRTAEAAANALRLADPNPDVDVDGLVREWGESA